MKKTSEPSSLLFNPQLLETVGHFGCCSSIHFSFRLAREHDSCQQVSAPIPDAPKLSRFLQNRLRPILLCCSIWVSVISDGLCGRTITQMQAPGMAVGLFSRHWAAGKSQTKPKNTAHCPRHHFSATEGFGLSPSSFCGSVEKCPLT